MEVWNMNYQVCKKGAHLLIIFQSKKKVKNCVQIFFKTILRKKPFIIPSIFLPNTFYHFELYCHNKINYLIIRVTIKKNHDGLKKTKFLLFYNFFPQLSRIFQPMVFPHFFLRCKELKKLFLATENPKRMESYPSHNLEELLPLIHTFDGKKLPPKPNKIVRPWKDEEDAMLLRAVEEYGTRRWHLVALKIPSRTRKQCRERYCNHLDPEIIKKPWTTTEDQILKEAKDVYGNRWTLIKTKLPGRTANQVKNRYFAKFSDVKEKPKINELNFRNEINELKSRTCQSPFKPVETSLYNVVFGGSVVH
ncbi:hypothetical protein EIN_399710 [Entamoeba invadens IP1]|uniref:Uncharacterized protein n=1 Tax=Entamoeba invadens IP1 TaxID=370355 RepID=A0A0A1UDR2_ENTIV|nr:hypothetical protein EIN_399710 [Entamoeba invadens IP1]ELP91931.1 hypothetical protein EIN_399710 [Entamoeba invadens IP1]|eukprot:XP_004258702.1 hypothetical protein EIN_399710 [Entamoeba invadens IP1]